MAVRNGAEKLDFIFIFLTNWKERSDKIKVNNDMT